MEIRGWKSIGNGRTLKAIPGLKEGSMRLVPPLVFCMAAMSPAMFAQTDQPRYVFAGTVQKLNASNVDMLPASVRTVIVRVDRVLKAPATMDDFTSREITVELIRGNSVKLRQQAIFLTNAWLFGKNLAVREVSHQAVNTEPALKLNLQTAGVRQADTALTDRLRPAVLVISGRVLDVSAVETAIRSQSEHDPDWWRARVEVTGTEKGQTAEKIVTVLFPNSTDEAWYNSHKFKAGEEGIFILQTQPAQAYKLTGFTALHPLDFQPMAERDRVRRLTQAIR
jgi:hypothetical protein